MRRYTVDIDIGGTLTDGVFSDGERVEIVKVDTTPHDLTVCFFECLQEGARRFGFDDLTRFLAEVAVVRWSSTIATNVIAERKGPKVGLLVSEGQSRDLYGQHESPAVGYLVQPEHIQAVALPLRREQVLEAVRLLLEQGVRRICVSLEGAYLDPEGERTIKRWIEEQYSDHYLGSVPVLLGSDMVHHPHDQTRTHLALINAYVHTPLSVALFKAEDEFLMHRYRRPLYIGHINGGVARVAKTKGVDTVESGPVFGLYAASDFAERYGLDSVLSLEVGGTTAKLGVVLNGQPATVEEGDLFGLPIKTPWVLLHSIALGGGSVAHVQNGQVMLGPESMGAYPGPACYDLGGERATLTDAFLVAGALNPERFLGGRRHLSVEQSRAALERDVAEPLGIPVEQAAHQVIDRAVSVLVQSSRGALQQINEEPHRFTLFAFGGNGANLAAGVAAGLGIGKSYVFQMGHVFSAYGSSLTNVGHVFEEWPYTRLERAEDAEEIARIIAGGRDSILRDLAGEGFSPDEAQVTTEVVLHERNSPVTLRMEPDDDGSYRAAAQKLLDEHRGALVERTRVEGVSPVPHYEPAKADAETGKPQADGQRALIWNGQGGEAAIFDWEKLDRGASLEGPAVIEGAANTCVVPGGWTLRVDEYGNGLMTAERS